MAVTGASQSKRGRGRYRPMAEINVTPMVDVMLVMLIIFMVITPMLSKGVSVDLWKAKNPISMANADKEDAIVVAITRDGKTFLGTTPVSAARIGVPKGARKSTPLWPLPLYAPLMANAVLPKCWVM